VSTFVARDRGGQATIHGERTHTAAGTRLSYVYTKRGVDVILAAALTVLFAPLLALIALLIVLDSRGPVFFRQQRVGARPRRSGDRVDWELRVFNVFKFRTMVRGADRSGVHEQFVSAFVAGEPAGVDGSFKLRHDPRVTRIGRLLRTTSLDELPQLFNVIAGTMSLVGPRPVPRYEVSHYEQRHRERLAARPGITGPWQVHGRGRVSFEEMVRMDIDYVRQQSLLLDLSLLVRTLPAVVSRRGAM
jgi:lipopolysaccharide/colanic/teichoic acid biosynthesis glycosyltransferase